MLATVYFTFITNFTFTEGWNATLETIEYETKGIHSSHLCIHMPHCTNITMRLMTQIPIYQEETQLDMYAKNVPSITFIYCYKFYFENLENDSILQTYGRQQ